MGPGSSEQPPTKYQRPKIQLGSYGKTRDSSGSSTNASVVTVKVYAKDGTVMATSRHTPTFAVGGGVSISGGPLSAGTKFIWRTAIATRSTMKTERDAPSTSRSRPRAASGAFSTLAPTGCTPEVLAWRSVRSA